MNLHWVVIVVIVCVVVIKTKFMVLTIHVISCAMFLEFSNYFSKK